MPQSAPTPLSSLTSRSLDSRELDSRELVSNASAASPPVSLRIVLMEPAGPLNVGSIARVMKNFGLSQLVLVNPQCDPLGDEARMMAVHAADVLEQAHRVETLPEALVGVHRAIATTGLEHDFPTPLESPRQVLPWLIPTPGTPACEGAIIFGREDSGLTTQELHYAQRLLHIPSHDGYTSLNLAQAVAVCCYELSQIWHESSDRRSNTHSDSAIAPPPLGGPPATEPPAPQDALEGLYQHLEKVLLKIGYLYPHTAASRMRRFRRLGHRAQPSSQEVHMLRGILSQVQWAVQNLHLKHPSQDQSPQTTHQTQNQTNKGIDTSPKCRDQGQ